MILDLDLLPCSSSVEKNQLDNRLPLRIMATDIAHLQQQQESSPITQYAFYNSHQLEMTPASSGQTSPTIPSPTLGQASQSFQARHQVRPLKSPLYMPAVLRPTTQPRRTSSKSAQSPLTPPRSIHNFIDDAQQVESPRALIRRMTNDSVALDSISEFEYGLASVGKVTAMPSKEHWKSDRESDICDDAICTRYFNYFTRRHHCRRCGNIFCDDHSNFSIPLDQTADFHPQGTPSRSCAHCYKEFMSWQYMRSSRSNSESSHDDMPSTPRTPLTPNSPNKVSCGDYTDWDSSLACAGTKRGGYFQPKIAMELAGSMGSVPRDWNWSTF